MPGLERGAGQTWAGVGLALVAYIDPDTRLGIVEGGMRRSIVGRGGSVAFFAVMCRAASRFPTAPTTWSDAIGFRLARTLDE